MIYLSSTVQHIEGTQYMNYTEVSIDWKCYFYLFKLGKQDGVVLDSFRSAHLIGKEKWS